MESQLESSAFLFISTEACSLIRSAVMKGKAVPNERIANSDHICTVILFLPLKHWKLGVSEDMNRMRNRRSRCHRTAKLLYQAKDDEFEGATSLHWFSMRCS